MPRTQRPAWRTYLDHQELVNVIQSRQGRHSVDDLLQGLLQASIQVDRVTVIRWLKELKNPEHPLSQHIRVVEEAQGTKGVKTAWFAERRLLPPAAPSASAPATPATNPRRPPRLDTEIAWLLLLAEKSFSSLIPDDYYDSSLQDFFMEAQRTLQRDELAKTLRDRTIFVPRGYQLYETPTQARRVKAVIGKIVEAIEGGDMLAFTYQGASLRVHPYALIYRSPKIYLYAREDDGPLRQFACSRMQDTEILEDESQVPAEFRITVDQVDRARHEHPERLLLQLFPDDGDNLIDDLKLFRLHPDQRLQKQRDGSWLLAIDQILITYQLEEWIGGRWGYVRVLEPTDFYQRMKPRTW